MNTTPIDIEDGREELGPEGCASNECDQPDCHRCFPRQGCTLHEKCREFTASGEALTEEGIAGGAS